MSDIIPGCRERTNFINDKEFSFQIYTSTTGRTVCVEDL